MTFFSFLLSFLLFLYAAMSPVLNYSIDPDFHVMAWGFTFLAFGFMFPGAVTFYRARGGRLGNR